MGVLLRVDEWDSKPEPAFEIDISDLAGLMEESWSVLPGSFRERCCRTLIMASFSMIWACRVLILFEKNKGRQCAWTSITLDWGLSTPQLWPELPWAFREAWRGHPKYPPWHSVWGLLHMYTENFTETPPHLWLLETTLNRHGRSSEARLRVMGGAWGWQKEKKKEKKRIFTKSGESAVEKAWGKTVKQ